MLLHVANDLITAAPKPTFDPTAFVSKLKLLGLALLAVALIWVSVVALFSHASKGNTRKSWNSASASLIALLPAVLAVGIGVVVFGVAVLDWAIPGLA